MKSNLRFLVLVLARYTGLFALSRFLTSRDLRILCYHGAALSDENEFRPGLFMTGPTFERRMKFIADAGYPVLDLGEALKKLERGTLPKFATVITIDDGWYGTYKHHYPVLRKYGFPATLYIASYYLEKQTPVFNVALSYVFWKQGSHKLDLAALSHGKGVAGVECAAVGDDEIYDQLNIIAETLDSASARQAFLREICDRIGFDWQALENERLFAFMNEDEARDLAANGIDIQLHTHRHRFPDTRLEHARTEIDDNRRILKSLARTELCHFCYPSGVYSKKSIAYLRELGIESATTTKPGFNRKGAPPLELTRFLDSEAISDLEFEAELSGFLELIRRSRLRR